MAVYRVFQVCADSVSISMGAFWEWGVGENGLCHVWLHISFGWGKEDVWQAKLFSPAVNKTVIGKDLLKSLDEQF